MFITVGTITERSYGRPFWHQIHHFGSVLVYIPPCSIDNHFTKNDKDKRLDAGCH